MLRLGQMVAAVLAVGGVCGVAPLAQAQTRPWIQYQDSTTSRVCGLIQGFNAEFVVLQDTGELVKVSGPDVTLTDLVADDAGNVYYLNEPAGFIDFDLDGDGERALFWLTLSGRLVEIDPFDASPSESDLSPRDVRSTGCDACTHWDDQAACQNNQNGNENGNDNGNGGGGFDFGSLCGAGSGGGLALSMALLLAGKGRRAAGTRVPSPM